MTVELRPEAAPDDPFLRRLITETIALELGAAAWPEPMRTHLIGIQYSGRRRASGESFIVEADTEPAGWLLLQPMPHETRLIEIMVDPGRRNSGIGAAAIRKVLESNEKPVSLTVNLTNTAAIRLYERLGFRIVESNEVQHVMRCGSQQEESWA